jgi:aldehyde dehydrogenase (NAD+)
MRYLVTGSALGSFALGFDIDPALYDEYRTCTARRGSRRIRSRDEAAFELGWEPADQRPGGRLFGSEDPVNSSQLYVGGQWVTPAVTETIPVENPATEEIIAHVPAARPRTSIRRSRRPRRLRRLGRHADGRARRGARSPAHRARRRAATSRRTVGLELGTPLKVAKAVQAGLPLAVLRGYADLAVRPRRTETIGNSLIVHEPVGVVGAITPWNYPLHQVVRKVAAALAAGCTVVLKPSELTPLVAYLLFDAGRRGGVPAGVLNLVTGTGPVVGAAIAGHPDVDMVSFTGSTATGRAITHAAADRIAKVALELGGKSANVILEDADLSRR